MFDTIIQNMVTPAVLFFALGLLAAALKSDLTFPKGLGEALSMYLLIAIGLKGGIELSQYSFTEVAKPILGTFVLGTITPIITLFVLRKWAKLDLKNSIALAATYGSVSIVTYGAAINFLEQGAIGYESFMNAMVVIMEVPAILISLVLLGILQQKPSNTITQKQAGIVAQNPFSFISKETLKESLFGKSVFLLTGSLLVGFVTGQDAYPLVKPLFFDLYQSILVLFLLNMGLIAGQQLAAVRKQGLKLLSFAIVMPLFYGVLGILVGKAAGLGLGGATLMGILAASASYIAAPAALRSSVPDANPSIYLGLALGITFPFNLMFGIPLFYAIAQWLYV